MFKTFTLITALLFTALNLNAESSSSQLATNQKKAAKMDIAKQILGRWLMLTEEDEKDEEGVEIIFEFSSTHLNSFIAFTKPTFRLAKKPFASIPYKVFKTNEESLEIELHPEGEKTERLTLTMLSGKLIMKDSKSSITFTKIQNQPPKAAK